MSRWAEAFALQADACRALGSQLTANICDAFARVIAQDGGAVSVRVREWPGDPTYRGDSVPLRLCGAVHGLVLTGQTLPFALDQDFDGRIFDILQSHEAWLLEWIEHAPQTNEVGRSGVLIAGASFLSQLSFAPFDLLELGASAGMNLNFPFYRVEFETDRHETSENPDTVILRPEWRAQRPDLRPLPIGNVRGVDLNPLDAQVDGLRLMAYVWPDQPQRLSRMRAALAVAQAHPPQVDRADAADWLEAQLSIPPEHGRLVYHTVAAQYFPQSSRARIKDALQSAGAHATADKPLAHLSMETDGSDGMALRLRLWDADGLREWDLGRAHAHAQWIDWHPQEILQSKDSR